MINPQKEDQITRKIVSNYDLFMTDRKQVIGKKNRYESLNNDYVDSIRFVSRLFPLANYDRDRELIY
jgi:hypothetical protein